MRNEDLQALKTNVDGHVKIAYTDGEVLIARLLSVSEEDQDAIYDVVSSTKPEHYKNPHASYLIRFDEIVSVEPTTSDQQPTT